MTIVIFDIDGVVRDVGGSYRRALADTVEHYTQGAYRPSPQDIDTLKAEGQWNNDWEASREMISRYYAAQGQGMEPLDYAQLVAWFQSRYRGPNPDQWTGYICQEPVLMGKEYLEQLTQAGLQWGFFSGATRASATYVLEHRLGLRSPTLVAMEDAPGKPDPTGLLMTINQLPPTSPTDTADCQHCPVIYAGDTVADMITVHRARDMQPDRPWFAVGVLPPHVQETAEQSRAYANTLVQAGAQLVVAHITDLTPARIHELVSAAPPPD